MSAQDYGITSRARRLLVSRWVDVDRLQIGATNGVVYVMGMFEPAVEDALMRLGREQPVTSEERRIRLVRLVEKELRRVPGVRDVVLRFDNLKKKSGMWQVVAVRPGRRRVAAGRRGLAGGRRHDLDDTPGTQGGDDAGST